MGRKEIQEAVVTAALVTLVGSIIGGIVGMGFKLIDKKLHKEPEKPKPAEKA